MTKINVMLVTFAMWAICDRCAAQLDRSTVRFVGDVLIGTEYSKHDQACMRWVRRPTLSTFGNGSHHPAMIQNVVRQLNECLPESQQIEIRAPSDETSTIKVHFIPHKSFGDRAKQLNFPYSEGDWGTFFIRWNGGYEIESADILIASDKLRGQRLHHFLLEEITQSLGLAGDSARFSDSVFYENGPEKKYGTATRLSDLDKKLIRFLYRRVEPGLHPVELGIQMARYWDQD